MLKSLSQIPAAAHAFLLLASGTWNSRILPGTGSHLSLFRRKRFVREWWLYCGAEHVRMCSQLHDISHNFGHVLNIVRSEYIILGLIIISLPSHVVTGDNYNKMQAATWILYYAKLLLLHQISKRNTVNGADKGHFFHEFTHCNLFLFSKAWRRDGLNLINNTFLLYVLGTCDGSSFRESFCHGPFWAFFAIFSCRFSRGMGRFITILG